MGTVNFMRRSRDALKAEIAPIFMILRRLRLMVAVLIVEVVSTRVKVVQLEGNRCNIFFSEWTWSW